MMITSPAVSMSRHSLSSSPRSTPSSSTSPINTTAYGCSIPLLPPDSPFSEMSASPGSEQSFGVVPKTEEAEEEHMNLDDIEDHASDSSNASASPRSTTAVASQKRGRGRPRKPKTGVVKREPGPNIRSKKGCFTCRRRKKKCDERKPECQNCEKNNVVCEGYPPREVWTSGRQKSIKSRRTSVIKLDLPGVIKGIENELDHRLLDYFHDTYSTVLTLFREKDNPFRELLIPMAIEHQGLMHALLCLAGTHLHSKGSTGDLTPAHVNERRLYHYGRAISILRQNEKMERCMAGDRTALIDDPTSASVIMLCLETITSGGIKGEYRPYMDLARNIVRTQKSANVRFQSFLFEFYVYHDVSNSITSDHESMLMMEDFQLPHFMIQPGAGTLLGVLDGLFGIISKIRKLRDSIRKRRELFIEPDVDCALASQGSRISLSLQEWVCPQEPGTPRWHASQLYCWATHLYLYRTIRAAQPSEELTYAVDTCLEILGTLSSDDSAQSILLMPLFLMGCSAFHEYQRLPIEKAFETLQEYSSLGNIKYAKEIVKLVWEKMDAGDRDNWDWESIIRDQGWDFLIT